MIARIGFLDRAVLFALAAAAAASAGEPPRAALVVGAPPAPPADAIDRARADLARRYTLVDEAEARAVLEGFRRAPSPAERARAAIERAHALVRRFAMDQAFAALDEAEAAARELPPTAEGRALAAEVQVRRAAAALPAGRDAEAARAMALALSIAPGLALDPARDPPALLALCERVRSARAASRVEVAIESDPPGATIAVGGAELGPAPRTIDLPPGPAWIAAALPGRAARAEAIDAAAGARLTLALPPLGPADRLGPLVDALRVAGGEARAGTARALAEALAVDAIAVVEGAGPLRIFSRAAPAPAVRLVTLPPPPIPWYRRNWVWGVGAAVAAAVIAGVVLAVVVPPGRDTVGFSCCR